MIGSKPHGRLASWLVGSVSDETLKNASCTVVVVRPSVGGHAGRSTGGSGVRMTGRDRQAGHCGRARGARADEPGGRGAGRGRGAPAGGARSGSPSETSLGDDLGLDSLAGIELATALEDRFSLRITDDELAALRTYGDLERLVLRKVAA